MAAVATEKTPLMGSDKTASVLRLYFRHSTQPRRYGTVVLGYFVGILLGTFMLSALLESGNPHLLGWAGHKGKHVPFDELQAILLETPSAEKAREWSKYYTSGAHLAGKNLSQARWTRDRWNEWGVKADIIAYDTYINYPSGHRLALLEKSKTSSSREWEVAFEATLKEDVLAEDPTTSLAASIPTFHGYSASGNVTGALVYVNYGTFSDYEDLVNANISLKGRIAIARYGGIFRGLKVKRAQELGAVGVILYSDPGDDGKVTEEHGYAVYPDGPARNPSSVQRGSVQFLSFAPGDPSTPGYPSKPGSVRQPVEGAIPSIPSLPISYPDALPLLKALNGHGPRSQDLGNYWTRNEGLGYKGVEYNIGPSPANILVNLQNEQDYTITPLWNVIGIINGTIADEVIVVGNHRDAWVAGGAGDPNSGSAVLNEAIRSFGEAASKGWRPLRTIVFASWDGEEYGLIGSTEWVEEYLPWLSKANVAYVNLDVGVRSSEFQASAAPLLHKLLYEVTSLVQSPNQTVAGQTVRDTWDGRIKTMGSGSDFTAFQDHAGIPSLDFGFSGQKKATAIYHYHSNYDSYHWMSEFGDPGFRYHRAMAQILGLTVAKLAETPLVFLNATDYAVALKGYVAQIESKLQSVKTSEHEPSTEEAIFALRARTKGSEIRGRPQDFRLGLARLYLSVAELTVAAERLDAESAQLTERLRRHLPWWRWWSRLQLLRQIRLSNTKYKQLERAFLYPAGLDGRWWFKHVVFAPGLWTGYAGAVLPGLAESVDNKDYVNAAKWVDIVNGCIKTAIQTIA